MKSKEEAEKLFSVQLWRACAGSCQLAVENACKAVAALFRPVVKTHELSKLIFDLTDYGDELTYKVPWEIYKEEHATKALEITGETVKTAEKIIAKKRKKL